MHILRHTDGFADVDRSFKVATTDTALQDADDALGSNRSLHANRTSLTSGALCRHREVSLLKAFSYWGDPKPREPEHVYDLRRYVLRVSRCIGSEYIERCCSL